MSEPTSRISTQFFIALAILIFGVIGGFTLGNGGRILDDSASQAISHTETAPAGPHLVVHADVDKKAGFTTISSEKLGENSNIRISYLGLRDVIIDFDSNTMRLEDAIRNRHISIEEINAYARLDARNNFCEEVQQSTNGLAKLTYRYPEFDLWTIYDIYETPDGNQHLISEYCFCAPGRTPSFLYMDDETGKRIDYEDWGITFEVSEACSTAITLKCNQSGGQQIGALIAEDYYLYKSNAGKDTEEYIEPLMDDYGVESDFYIPISSESSTEFTIDFSSLYGELPAGNYVIYLSITDQYDKENVHPLMRNFYDDQLFDIAFTIK